MMRVRHLDGLWSTDYPVFQYPREGSLAPVGRALARCPITPAFDGVKSQSRIFMKAISIVAITGKQETGTLVYFNVPASCMLPQR